MNYLLVIIATILLALDFAVSQRYRQAAGTALTTILRFNAWCGLFTALVFFAAAGFRIEFSLYSAVLALLIALCITIYIILGFRILKAGNVAVYSMFLMTGGMLLPFLFGILFLEETLSVFRIAGLMLILTAVILMNRSGRPVSRKLLLLGIAVFALNGLVSIFSKCHQVGFGYETVDTMQFVLYTGMARCAANTAALLCCKKEQTAAAVPLRTVLWFALLSAVAGGGSYLFQLYGTSGLPATVLYPMVTGGSIIFSAFAGWFFFREKLSLWQKISIAVCFAGTLLFL